MKITVIILLKHYSAFVNGGARIFKGTVNLLEKYVIIQTSKNSDRRLLCAKSLYVKQFIFKAVKLMKYTV